MLRRLWLWKQEARPAQLLHDARPGVGLLDGQVGYCVHDPLEIFRPHGMVVGIRRGIQKIDGVRHVGLDGDSTVFRS